MKAFYWFASTWLVAAAACAVIAIASGYDWHRVSRVAFSLGVMPIVTAFGTIGLLCWVSRYQERHYPQD